MQPTTQIQNTDVESMEVKKSGSPMNPMKSSDEPTVS